MKTTFKAIAVAAFMALFFGGVTATAFAYNEHQCEKQERAYLLDFIHYCQGNEGLVQVDSTKDYTKSSTHDLKKLAKFYLEQDNYADVSDYWDITVIDGIVYPEAKGRIEENKGGNK